MFRSDTGLICDVCGAIATRNAPGARDSRYLASLDGWAYQRMSDGRMMDVCSRHPRMGVHERERRVQQRRLYP